MKYIFLVRGDHDESYEAFQARMLEVGQQLVSRHDPTSLKLTLTSFAPPVLSIIPFRKKKIAAFSMTDPGGDLAAPIVYISGIAGGYTVSEAIPVAYEKTWADREQSPGVCLLTIFRKKPGLDHETFIDRWHNSHTPLSLKIHPLWNYSRNVVTGPLHEGSENWNGIVEEHFRTSSDLLNPFRFFGNPLVIGWHMLQVYLDTKSFLEYSTIEPYLAVEYHLRSSR